MTVRTSRLGTSMDGLAACACTGLAGDRQHSMTRQPAAAHKATAALNLLTRIPTSGKAVAIGPPGCATSPRSRRDFILVKLWRSYGTNMTAFEKALALADFIFD